MMSKVRIRWFWSFRSDSNWRPAHYKCAALPTEPRKHTHIIKHFAWQVNAFVLRLNMVCDIIIARGSMAQLVSALLSHSRGHRFKSCYSYHVTPGRRQWYSEEWNSEECFKVQTQLASQLIHYSLYHFSLNNNLRVGVWRDIIGSPGGVSEWSNVPVSKTGVPQGTVGSNPIPSAKNL